MAITRRELITNIAKAGVPAAVAMTVGTETLQAEETFPFPTPRSDSSMTPASASVAKPARQPVTKRTTRPPIPAVTGCTSRRPT